MLSVTLTPSLTPTCDSVRKPFDFDLTAHVTVSAISRAVSGQIEFVCTTSVVCGPGAHRNYNLWAESSQEVEFHTWSDVEAFAIVTTAVGDSITPALSLPPDQSLKGDRAEMRQSQNESSTRTRVRQSQSETCVLVS